MTTITIALLPRETLNANQRMHWAAKARLTASIRARATIAYRQAGSPQMGRAHCTVHVSYPDRPHPAATHHPGSHRQPPEALLRPRPRHPHHGPRHARLLPGLPPRTRSGQAPPHHHRRRTHRPTHRRFRPDDHRDL